MISTILPAYKYLIEQRKLSEEIIRKFSLGYCDAQGEIYIGADFNGVLPQLDKRFYHSTIFPIMDLYNNCIAVSARPLGPTATKYINTSYEKSDHLYGLNVTWKDCLSQQRAYVVEGNISLLMPWQCGIKNIVAMLGKTFSFTQLCLLNRFVKNIIFVPDGDSSGQKLVEKLRNTIPSKYYDSDVKFSYIELPKDQDPDDFFKIHTKEEFLALPTKELSL